MQMPQQSGNIAQQLPGDAAEAPGANSGGGCSCGLETDWPGELRKRPVPLDKSLCPRIATPHGVVRRSALLTRVASLCAGGAPGAGLEPPGSRQQGAAEAAGAGAAAAPQLVIDLTDDDAAASGVARTSLLPTSSHDRPGGCAGAGCGPVPAAEQRGWTCAACTLVNSERTSTCAACGGANPAAGGAGQSGGGGDGGGSRKQLGTASGIRLGLGGVSSSGSAGAVRPGSSGHAGSGSGSGKQGGGGVSRVRVGLGADGGSSVSCAATSASPHSLHGWCCRFCTLQNVAADAHCCACGQWRFSSGAPTASRPTVEQKM